MLAASSWAGAGPLDIEKVSGPLLGRRSKSGRPTHDDSWWADKQHCDGPTSVHHSLSICVKARNKCFVRYSMSTANPASENPDRGNGLDLGHLTSCMLIPSWLSARASAGYTAYRGVWFAGWRFVQVFSKNSNLLCWKLYPDKFIHTKAKALKNVIQTVGQLEKANPRKGKSL